MCVPYPARDRTTGTAIGKKSATVLPKSDRRRGPGRNLMLCIAVAGGGGGESPVRHIPFLSDVVEPASALCCLTVTATKMVGHC